jgi:hypothetical protein
MNLNLKTTDLAAIVLALVACWNPPIGLIDTPIVPTPTVPTPTVAMQAVVAPIAALVVGDKAPGDRAALSEYYAAWGDVLERDGGTAGKKKIATTAVLAAANESAGLLMYQQTGIKGRYATLADSIQKARGECLGIADLKGGWLNVPLDDAKRAKAVEFERALSWAFSQPLPAKG